MDGSKEGRVGKVDSTTLNLTHSVPSANYYYCRQSVKHLLSRDNKSEILGHLSECMGRAGVANL